MSAELAVAQNAPDRHARRSAETRDRLLVAARKLFVERGYHATRPQDIAREADVAAGTFYTHFTDKREAFLAFVAKAGSELMERIERRSSPAGFKERLTNSLNGLLEYEDENPGVLGAAFTDPAMIDRDSEPVHGMREELAQSLMHGLERGIREGHLRSDFDPQLIAHGIVGLIHQALVHGRSAAVDRAELIDQITRFCELAIVQESESTRTGAVPPSREDP